MRPADCLSTNFAQAEMANFSFLDQICHGAGDILYWYRTVDAMLVVKIDIVGLQPPERSLARGFDSFGAIIVYRWVFGEVNREFRTDNHFVAEGRDGPAQQLFVATGVIALGGVEELASVVVCLLNKLLHHRLGRVGRGRPACP